MKMNGTIATITELSLRDHGRRMSLQEFECADAPEGLVFELSRGVVTHMNVADVKHERQIGALRIQTGGYQAAQPDVINMVAGNLGCKLLSSDYESERHPDLSIYLVPPPAGKDFWWKWIPEIVVEVVSKSSRRRDYEEKSEEYLGMGVKEYWIIDADQEKITIRQRVRGKWKEKILGRDDTYEIKLLPGFQLHCRPIFEAAEKS